jgi:hypothetical protein
MSTTLTPTPTKMMKTNFKCFRNIAPVVSLARAEIWLKILFHFAHPAMRKCQLGQQLDLPLLEPLLESNN